MVLCDSGMSLIPGENFLTKTRRKKKREKSKYNTHLINKQQSTFHLK